MRPMYQFDQLPEWIDMGEDEDFTTPAVSLAEQLKKRMKKSSGDLGGGMGGMIETPKMSSGTGAAKGGPSSL